MGLRDWLRGKQPSETRPAYGGLVEMLQGRDLGRARTTRAVLDAYSYSPRLRAVVSKIAYEVASTEWRVLRETGRGRERGAGRRVTRTAGERRDKAVAACVKQGELEPVEEHPLLDFLHTGNALLGGHEVLQTTQMHIDLVGNGFWVLELSGTGRPVEAWPWPPHLIAAVPTPGAPNVFKIRGEGGEEHSIPAEAMVWFRDPDPKRPWGLGSGLGTSLWDEIQTDEMAARFQRSTLGNRARPDSVVSLEGAERDEAEAFEQGFLNKFKGWWNAGRPLITNRKLGIQRLSQTFEELQLKELREFERDFIIQVYGVPPEKLGILQDSNRATIEGADLTFAVNVLVPRIDRLRSVLQERIVPRFDERLVLDFVSPVESDRGFELKVMQGQPSAFTIDDWRDRAGFEALESGGDRRLQPLNLVELSEEEAIRKAAAPPRTKVDPGDLDVEALLDEIRDDDLLDAIGPGVRESAREMAEETAREAGSRLTIDERVNRIIDEALASEAAERVSRVNDTTKADIRAALQEGLAERETVSQLSSRIREVFESSTNRRSLRIARTETAAAATIGSEAGMSQVGVEEKQWLSSRDGLVRHLHQPGAGLDGEHVPLGQSFTDANGATGPGPGRMSSAASTVNCRCTLIPYFPDERSLMGSEEKATAVWKTRESIRLPIERQVRSAVVAAMKTQRDAVIARLRRSA